MLKVISPVDGSVYAERKLSNEAEVLAAVKNARTAFQSWKKVPIEERAAICNRFVDALVSKKDDVAREITMQMGRPISQSPGELRGFAERARHMIKIAASALADIKAPSEKEGFTRFIRREPHGVVLTIAAWNYPLLTAVNSVVPAIMAGNTLILKQSSCTPLCAERFAEAFAAAGIPENVFQAIHMTHAATEEAIKNAEGVDHVVFTGSVEGGRQMQAAAAKRFIGVSLELGGKDPAYVRGDANLADSVPMLVDGSFFNSGQCCCAVERIYVHESVYEQFVAEFVAETKKYVLGNPLDPNVNLGPCVKTSAADFVRKQIKDAISKGAKALIEPGFFPAEKDGTPYLGPQVLVDVNHQMAVMMDESFGPVIGIMKVSSDEEAVRLMNDSPFGLTAIICTTDDEAALAIGDQVNTGTWFANKCDYLDPELAWVGVKDSGRGCALSSLGYDGVTRPKSFNVRHLKK